MEDELQIQEGNQSENCLNVSTPKRMKVERASSSLYLAHFENRKCKYCHFQSSSERMKSSNAQRHLERAHSSIANDIAMEIKGKKESYLGARRNFAIYAGTTTFPLHHIENEFLQKALNGNTENKATIPTCLKTLKSDILKEHLILKSNIKDILQNSTFIALSTDIATTKGMRYSYMGVIAHVWDGYKCRALGIGHFELFEQHKSTYIRKLLEDSMKEYNIPVEKIVRVVTDSAANMKAAFVKPFAPFSDTDPEYEDNFVNMEIASVEEMQKLHLLYTGNMNSTESAGTKIDVNGYNHISCVAHRLQLALKDVFEVNAQALEIRKVVFKLLNSFSKSHNATRDLHHVCGKKLLFPANTRWYSLHITYSRLLEILPYVNKIAKEKQWKEITPEQANKIKGLCEIVAPFRGFTDKLQSDRIPTISLLFPGIKQLIKCIENTDSLFPEINKGLVSSLRTRFADILCSGLTGDSIFIITSYLDPELRKYIISDPKEEWLAQVEIKNWCVTRQQYNVMSAETGEKQMNIDHSLGFAIECSTQKQQANIDTEISTFFADRKRPNFMGSNAASYWKNNCKAYPTLSKLVEEVLCVPATSAAVERMFSQTTLHTSGHKTNTGPELTTAKVLLAFNKDLISRKY